MSFCKKDIPTQNVWFSLAWFGFITPNRKPNKIAWLKINKGQTNSIKIDSFLVFDWVGFKHSYHAWFHKLNWQTKTKSFKTYNVKKWNYFKLSTEMSHNFDKILKFLLKKIKKTFKNLIYHNKTFQTLCTNTK